MAVKKTVLSETAQECNNYRPIQALKSHPARATYDLEMAEDLECDSCVHYKNEQCDVYLNKGFE